MKLNPISKSEALRYMGVRGDADEQTVILVDKAEQLVREKLSPKYVYRKAPLTFTEEGVFIGDMTVPLTGKDVKKHLSGCTEAVVFAATLTAEADKLIRQAEVSDMAEALAVDCICSAAIEQVCNQAEQEIFSAINAEFRTWRFSPGYGDLPLDAQKNVLHYLNAARRIGLTVTDNSLLIPAKSVTAIIGVSEKKLNKGAKGCAVCNMRETCAFSGKNCCGKSRISKM